ncbi:MAG: hypothetical protein HZA36_00575 [Parcubacteria group bacterium]|nr:hypothetical protein [Parcubacteria group bacterium]
MKNKYLVFLLVLSSIPLSTSAQGLIPCSGPNCSLCDLFVLVNNIFLFLVQWSPILAFFIIGYAGILMITFGSNSSKVNQARGMIWTTLQRLIIIYCSFLIVNVVIHFVVGENKLAGTWYKFSCKSTAAQFANTEIKNVQIHSKDDGRGGIVGGGGAGTEYLGGGSPGGGNNDAVANEALKQVGRSSYKYNSDAGNACASVVSTVLINQGVMQKSEFQAGVGGLATKLYAQKGYTTIITDPSQLRPGDIVFVNPHSLDGKTNSLYPNKDLQNLLKKRGVEPWHVGIWTNTGLVNNSTSQLKVAKWSGVKPLGQGGFEQMAFALRKQ